MSYCYISRNTQKKLLLGKKKKSDWYYYKRHMTLSPQISMPKPDYLLLIRILQDTLVMCSSYENFSFESAESMLFSILTYQRFCLHMCAHTVKQREHSLVLLLPLPITELQQSAWSLENQENKMRQ